jgi:hypothetical protein
MLTEKRLAERPSRRVVDVGRHADGDCTCLTQVNRREGRRAGPAMSSVVHTRCSISAQSIRR